MIGEIVEGLLEWVIEDVLGYGCRLTGYVICLPFSDTNRVDSQMSLIVGMGFWFAVWIALFWFVFLS